MAASSESHRLQMLSKIGLLTVGVALVLTVAGAWFASSRPVAEIDASKFQNYSDSLQSYANESSMLAVQYEHGRSTANYAAVSADKLREAVSNLAEQLQTETPKPGLKDKVDRAAGQASDLSDILADMSKAAENDTPGKFSDKIQAIAARVEKP
jgi:hypothetical protein